jgi:glycosyltransferase involved in cell wall biosynthesis
MKITLCLIVWNELGGCQIDVPNLPIHEFSEIIAIDGGSTDGTVEYLKSSGISVYQQTKKGLNAAYVDANKLANSDYIVVYFPKGTMPTSDLLKFKPLLQLGNDLVIASRQIRGSTNEEDSAILKPRKWGVRALAIMIALIWMREGILIRDVLHGVKAWKKDSLEKMNILYCGLSIDLEMVVRSYKLKLKRVEFPTTEIPRPHGQTNFKIWPTAKKLIKYIFFELKREEEKGSDRSQGY